jgi:hypothetical protein
MEGSGDTFDITVKLSLVVEVLETPQNLPHDDGDEDLVKGTRLHLFEREREIGWKGEVSQKR